MPLSMKQLDSFERTILMRSGSLTLTTGPANVVIPMYGSPGADVYSASRFNRQLLLSLP